MKKKHFFIIKKRTVLLFFFIPSICLWNFLQTKFWLIPKIQMYLEKSFADYSFLDFLEVLFTGLMTYFSLLLLITLIIGYLKRSERENYYGMLLIQLLTFLFGLIMTLLSCVYLTFAEAFTMGILIALVLGTIIVLALHAKNKITEKSIEETHFIFF